MFKKKEDLDQLKISYDALYVSFTNLEIDYAKKKQKLDSDLSEWFIKEKEAMSDRIVKARLAISDINVGLECEYHNTMEKRNTEIAKLDAMILEKKRYIEDTNKHNAYCESMVTKLLEVLNNSQVKTRERS